jgi:HEAT repeat protein
MSGQTDPPANSQLETALRLRAVVVAGHQGDRDIATAHLHDTDPTVRAAALSALNRSGALTPALVSVAAGDTHALVRRRAAELSVEVPAPILTALLGDPDSSVVELSCFATGEIDWESRHTTAPIAELATIATSHDDALCRESAAAALGAIGDPAGLDAVLAACEDRVTVRRRAILALAAFTDPRVDAALHHALDDKDWQVRQAAEDLLEVGRSLEGNEDPDAYAE